MVNYVEFPSSQVLIYPSVNATDGGELLREEYISKLAANSKGNHVIKIDGTTELSISDSGNSGTATVTSGSCIIDGYYIEVDTDGSVGVSYSPVTTSGEYLYAGLILNFDGGTGHVLPDAESMCKAVVLFIADADGLETLDHYLILGRTLAVPTTNPDANAGHLRPDQFRFEDDEYKDTHYMPGDTINLGEKIYLICPATLTKGNASGQPTTLDIQINLKKEIDLSKVSINIEDLTVFAKALATNNPLNTGGTGGSIVAGQLIGEVNDQGVAYYPTITEFRGVRYAGRVGYADRKNANALILRLLRNFGGGFDKIYNKNAWNPEDVISGFTPLNNSPAVVRVAGTISILNLNDPNKSEITEEV